MSAPAVVTVPRCGAELPCGIRDGRWKDHVCGRIPGHADCCSPCRCVACSDRCPTCGSVVEDERFVVAGLSTPGEECQDEWHGLLEARRRA